MKTSSGDIPLHQVTDYAHGTTDLLGIQIDAAINDGNSGAAFCSDQQ